MSGKASMILVNHQLKTTMPTTNILISKSSAIDWPAVYRQLELMDKRIDFTIQELQHADIPTHQGK